MSGGSSQELLDLIRTSGDSADQLTLIRRCISGIAFEFWSEDLDLMVALAYEALRIAGSDDETLLETANIICFNTSANLADCWGDDFERSSRHFEHGLAFAEKAILLRHRLRKPPSSLAMAYWAKGKHLMSLGRMAEARAAMLESAQLTCEDEMSDGHLIARGYLAIIDNHRGAAEKVGSALKTLFSQRTRAEDCRIISDQLKIACQTSGSTLASAFELE